MQDAAPLTPVREAHRFDEAALRAYLRGRLPGCEGDVEVLQFEGGQSNPTYRLDAGGHSYVLRKKPPGKLLPSAHQVEREYRVMSALQGSDVPVPRTWLLCEDPEVIGTPFYVMDCVEGRVITDARMPNLTPRRAHGALRRLRARARGAAPHRSRRRSASPTSAARATTTRARSRAGASSTRPRRPRTSRR